MKKGRLINVAKPEIDQALDSYISGYSDEIVERRYVKVTTYIYDPNLDSIQKKYIIVLVGIDKTRSKKYIIADIDMDNRFDDEYTYIFDKTNLNTLAYWETNAPIFSFPYSVMDKGQVVQKYAMHRIIPWNLIKQADLNTLIFDIILNPIDHYESNILYNKEHLLVSDMGDLGHPDKAFSVVTNDIISEQSVSTVKYRGDIIKYNLKNYKIESFEKGRIDYLVLISATTDDMNESLKPYFPGNTPQDITFTIASNNLEDSLYSYRGKFLLLNFWGTWCGPCRKITPDLIKLNKSIDNNKINMLGINCEFGNGQAHPQRYIDEENIDWPQVFEVIEKENKGFLNTAKITSFPSLILIDDKGVVQARVSKPEEIQQLINDINAKFKK